MRQAGHWHLRKALSGKAWRQRPCFWSSAPKAVLSSGTKDDGQWRAPELC